MISTIIILILLFNFHFQIHIAIYRVFASISINHQSSHVFCSCVLLTALAHALKLAHSLFPLRSNTNLPQILLSGSIINTSQTHKRALLSVAT